MAEEAHRLNLWDADFVLDWFQRNDAYIRLRDRANADRPAITVQALAEVLRSFRMRPGTADRIEMILAEIREHLIIVELTVERADAYAEVVTRCRRSGTDIAHEAWFAWQVALSRREGCRIMTKAPQRYRGLVDPTDLA